MKSIRASEDDVQDTQALTQVASLTRWVPLGFVFCMSVIISLLTRGNYKLVPKPNKSDEDIEIDGGEVRDIESSILIDGGQIEDITSPYIMDPIKGHETKTGRVIAYGLLGLLSAIIIGHYLATMILMLNGIPTEGIDHTFSTVLPAVVGLVGSAVTYFFTRATTK